MRISLQLMNGSLLALGLISTSFCAQAAIPTNSRQPVVLGILKTNLESIFAKESTSVVFTFYPPAPPTRAQKTSYAVESIDSNGNTQRLLGRVHDEGFMGDAVAHDDIYGYKFQINEKKPGTLHFRIVDQTQSPPKPVSVTVSLEVVGHPSFQDLLVSVWHKVQARMK